MKVYALFLTFLVCFRPTFSSNFFQLPSPWGWACEEDKCVKKSAGGPTSLLTLNTCKITCGPAGALWPLPTMAIVGNEVANFLPTNLTHSLTCGAGGDSCQLLQEAVTIFQDNLHRYHPNYKNGSAPWVGPWDPPTLRHKLHLDVTIQGGDGILTLDTDESYELAVSRVESVTTAVIIAPTFFGARHALETLSQLAEYHETTNSLVLVTNATVSDAPAFKYRGLLVDTSRNFISVGVLERTLEGMASTKLNTLHLHLTDTHSWPLYLPGLPNMAYYGAYSPSNIYTPQDMRHLQHYARVRGIRLVPEIDGPAHVGNGWQWGPKEGLGNLAVCVNQEPWQEFCVEPPCGQFNLANPNMYTVLRKIYFEIYDIFNSVDIFHYGGDEVNLNCWNTTDEIVEWMTANNHSLTDDAYYEQWGIFQEKARLLMADAAISKRMKEPTGMIWTSHLTEMGRELRYLNQSKYIIQIWSTGDDPVITKLLQEGYKLVFSNHDAWYLDCGAGAWVGEGNNWCSPYKGWQAVYNNNPHRLALELTGNEYKDAILGGEAALWTEQADDATVDAKLWPRGAALGERLWSNPSTSWSLAELRLIHHRQRLMNRGIMADRIQPQWCHQNERLCYL
ncbi:hypothetical protein Pmani_020138 [Petrolisthes manimaculis]|uniref:Beta-hexosaminidase n=1 Tax=Petrolisthes manimaculis TaxID=1843537 RepID=A0AAE1PJ16_9EUCA|nr:hypothetical protein Pmani_020138 [Petrolisthes manimaculis]